MADRDGAAGVDEWARLRADADRHAADRPDGVVEHRPRVAVLSCSDARVPPSVVFGRPAGELTARLSYVDFDGARALAAAGFSAHDQPLDEDFVLEYCPRVIEAVDRICTWLES